MLKKAIISVFLIGVLGTAAIVGISIHNAADRSFTFTNTSTTKPIKKPNNSLVTKTPVITPSAASTNTVSQQVTHDQLVAQQDAAKAKQAQAIAQEDKLKAQQNINNANAIAQQQQQIQVNYQQDAQQSTQHEQTLTYQSPATPTCNTAQEAQDAIEFQNSYNKDIDNTYQAIGNTGYSPPFVSSSAIAAVQPIEDYFQTEWTNLKIEWLNEMAAINCNNPVPAESGLQFDTTP